VQSWLHEVKWTIAHIAFRDAEIHFDTALGPSTNIAVLLYLFDVLALAVDKRTLLENQNLSMELDFQTFYIAPAHQVVDVKRSLKRLPRKVHVLWDRNDAFHTVCLEPKNATDPALHVFHKTQGVSAITFQLL
jgi:hypothetical protein